MIQYNNWICLLLAGLLEVVWVIGLKYTEGFTQLWPSLFTTAAMIASGALLSFAVKTIPIGTAYPVWVGIGAVGAAIAGIMLFDEPAIFLRIGCIFLILLGVTGLSLLKAGI